MTTMRLPSVPRRAWITLAVIVGLAGFVGANAHLLFVALTSQPDCVEHLKAPGEPGTFQAAKSAC